MRRVAVSLALIAAMFVAGTHAWWCTGHMVIAEIARQNLNPGVLERVEAQFTYLNQWFPQSNNMVSGACWADDLKSNKLEVMAGWHFINQPYNPDSVPIHPWPIQEVNVETNIMKLGDTLKNRDINDWIKAFATGNLVHFMGDIHQPLHATELYDETFAEGDKGGNLFKVYWQGTEWRLHFIWDSLCAAYQTEIPRPLSETDYEFIKSLAYQYNTNFTVPSDEQGVYNSTIMALESLDAAVKYSYDNHNLQPNANLTQSYIDTCKTVVGYRLTFAAYRLASDLNYLFKDDSHSGHAILGRLREHKSEYNKAIHDFVKARRSKH